MGRRFWPDIFALAAAHGDEKLSDKLHCGHVGELRHLNSILEEALQVPLARVQQDKSKQTFSRLRGEQDMPNENPNPLPKNYQWPADKLKTAAMAILHRWREKTGRPINHILREAVLKFKVPTNSEAEALTNFGAHHAEKE